MLLHDGAAAPARGTLLHRPVGAPAALALLADLLLLDVELVLVARVEVLQRHADADFHVRPAALALLVAEVAGAAEEAGEEVEGVVAAAAAAVAGFVLRQAFVAVLVVDGARFGGGEAVVGFGDFDEALRGGFVAPVVTRCESVKRVRDRTRERLI